MSAGVRPGPPYANAGHGVVTIEPTFDPARDVGSGFVVDARRGLIVTASHVVAPAVGAAPAGRLRHVHRARRRHARRRRRCWATTSSRTRRCCRPTRSASACARCPWGGRARCAWATRWLPSAARSRIAHRSRRASSPSSIADRGARRLRLPHHRRDPDRRRGQPGQLRRAVAGCRGQVVGMVTAVNKEAQGGVSYAVPIEAVEAPTWRSRPGSTSLTHRSASRRRP